MTNPKTFLYDSAKKLRSVESMWRRGVLAGGRGVLSLRMLDPGWRTSPCHLRVTIAVCVMLRGIIVFFTGTLSTIWTASAAKNGSVEESIGCIEKHTIAENVEFCN